MKKITYLILSFAVFAFLITPVYAAETQISGSGTEASPYSVTEGIANQNGLKWVEGYIVGNIDGTGMSITTESKFAAPFVVSTNVLIAASPTETDYNNCLPVQLLSGAIRTGLNLVDNAGNLGKKVKMYGSLEAYFGVPGFKSASYYELEGGTTGGTKPADTSGALLTETLLNQTSFDKFTAYSVKGDQVWYLSTSYGACMSGYSSGTSYENEDWFITPALDLTGQSNVILSFDHARGPAGSITVGVTEGYYTVWASSNYVSGDPTLADWTEITGVTHGTTGWGYVSSGNLTVPTSKYSSGTRIGFKYLSINGASATWEIKNLLIKGSTTGIENHTLTSPEFYISNGKLYSNNINCGSQVEIFSLTGAKVKTLNFENGIDLSKDLNKGIYIIRSGNLTQKIAM